MEYVPAPLPTRFEQLLARHAHHHRYWLALVIRHLGRQGIQVQDIAFSDYDLHLYLHRNHHAEHASLLLRYDADGFWGRTSIMGRRTALAVEARERLVNWNRSPFPPLW